MRILLVGGGTGGHVYPLMAVAKSLQEQSVQKGIDLELMVVGEGKFIERAIQENGLNFKPILAGKFRRYISPLVLVDIVKIPLGIIQSFWLVFWFMPDAIFSKGGYSSLGPVLAGWLYFIPVYIHESDAVPGLANKFLSKFSKKVFLAFKSSENYFPAGKAMVVGNPIQKEIAQGNKSEAIEFFQLDPNRKTVLVLGGSLGARAVNDIISQSLVMMVGKNLQIIHQCGENNYDDVKKELDKIIKEGEGEYGPAVQQSYRLYPFLNLKEIALAYAICDAVISRAGAGLLSEISLVGKPAVLIPLVKGSRGEQVANAFDFAKYGAKVIEEENLTPNILVNQLESVLDPANYQNLSNQIKSFVIPDAADKIAGEILG